MPRKPWFLSKRRWLQGGLIGILICAGLLIFNILIYFPLLNGAYDGTIPNRALIPPMITGHAFPLLAHFMVPYGWGCEFSEPTCVHWSAEITPGAIPWTTEGETGYCLEQIMTPTASCAERAEIFNFIGLTMILFLIYFIIGAVIGIIIEKKKNAMYKRIDDKPSYASH